MIDELNEYYTGIKNVMEILPTNNKNNINKKIAYIDEEIKKDNERIDCVKREIEDRISKFDMFNVDENIKKYEIELKKCNILDEWNNYNTSFEKMHLDYHLYQLKKYYKEDLSGVNSCIKKIIESFKTVNIDIKESDFNFNTLAGTYMDKIINNATDEELNTCFEEIYWKNSDIIKIIEINFKGIYLQNEKKINKYYENRHEEFLKNSKGSEMDDIRIKLNSEIERLKETDPYLVFQKFLTGEYSISDYKITEVEKKKSIYFAEDSYNFEKLKELYKILNEYNVIIKYKYLLDDMKSKLQEKDTFKNSKSNVLKELNKLNKEIIKLNSSQNKKSLFGKKKKNDEKWLFKYKETLSSLITKYDEYDDACFNNLIFEKITQDSTIYDVLKLITSNYIYFVKKTLELDENRSISSITDTFNELKNYINNNNFALLNSIALLDEKQMKELIINKYNLENITLTTDSLLSDNIDKTISDIKMLMNSENIKMSGINLDDIYLYIEYSKMNSQ